MINSKYVYEIVRTFEIEPISLTDVREEPILLRIEVLKSKNGVYKVKVYRGETFRIGPTYPLDEANNPITEKCDKTFFINEYSHNWDEIKASSEQEALNQAFIILEKNLSIKLI
jgi:hypothetical protein